MGIHIPQTLVLWESSCRITLAIWVTVGVTGDASHITRVLGMRMTVTPGQLSPSGQQETEHARALLAPTKGLNFTHIGARIS